MQSFLAVRSFTRVALLALMTSAVAACDHTPWQSSPSPPAAPPPVAANPTPPAPAAPVIQSGMLVGGATRQMTVENAGLAGFLPQPELLEPGKPGQLWLTYLDPRVKPGVYDKVILEPVTIWSAPGSQWSNVPPGQREVLANTLQSDLYHALKHHCQMVTTTTRGTLRLRFALVDANSPNTAINTIATYAPYASTAYSAASFVFNKGVGYFAGTATIAGVMTDATDGTLLWEGVDKRGGTTTLVANTLDDWRDIHHAFEDWSKGLRNKLEAVGVCHK